MADGAHRYYDKLAKFQNFMVNISAQHFPEAYPAVLYPGSSPNVHPAVRKLNYVGTFAVSKSL
jgi:hypothetical protein